MDELRTRNVGLKVLAGAMADPKTNAVEVAHRLGMTTTTLYAYVNGDGTLKQAGQALLIAT